MRVMKKGIILLFLAGILMISAVSAEILISQPKDLYNRGDTLEMTVTLSSSEVVDGIFSAKLICNSDEVELYRNPESLIVGGSKVIDVKTNLVKSFIGNLTGECYVRGYYAGDDRTSQKFIISNKINVNIDVGTGLIGPGETFVVSGNAKKENGNNLNGYAEMTINPLNVSFSQTVTDGKILFNYTMLSDAQPSVYNVNVRVYEKDSKGDVINVGSVSQSVKVKQIIEKAAVALNNQNITPGNELIYTALVYDQANNEVKNEDVKIVIYSPSDEVFVNKLIKSSEAQRMTIALNQSPGSWNVETSRGEISASIRFFVAEYEKIDFTLVNGTLIVRNVGNVPYNKDLSIKIGDTNDIKAVKIGVGKSEEIKLVASDGNYSILVDDGTNSKDLGVTFLSGARGTTGYAISFGEGSVFSNTAVIMSWIIVLAILVYIAYLYYRRVRKRSFMGMTPSSGLKKASVLSMAPAHRSPQNGNIIDSGNKETCGVIALKIGNIEELKNSKSNALDYVKSALQKAKEKKAKIYADGDYRLIILSPSVLNGEDVSLKAASTAWEMRSILEEYNKKYINKIKYGIGAHVGELIVEHKDGDLKFSSLGNTTLTARKVAESAHSDVFISEFLYKKVVGKVKADHISGKNMYKLTRVTDRGTHVEFLNKFNKRQEK